MPPSKRAWSLPWGPGCALGDGILTEEVQIYTTYIHNIIYTLNIYTLLIYIYIYICICIYIYVYTLYIILSLNISRYPWSAGFEYFTGECDILDSSRIWGVPKMGLPQIIHFRWMIFQYWCLHFKWCLHFRKPPYGNHIFCDPWENDSWPMWHHPGMDRMIHKARKSFFGVRSWSGKPMFILLD